MSKFNLDNLTTEQKIGQLIMFGFDAFDVNDHVLKLIKENQVGNVILFARNVESPEQLFTLNQNLQKLAYENIGVPLLISIDQEGGMVTRIKNGGTYFPGAMTTTGSNNTENAYLTGKYMGKELISLGINLNLAPVLDVNNNPNNPVIGVRSYSSIPKLVSEFGNEFIRGMQENVIATAKHFPGHGDTNTDSHLALPTINYGEERLDEVELYPFKKAIKNGVKAIMSSHINFPAFTEDNLPTTLSKKCLTGLLRGRLGFEGLIVTDCMQMKAIQIEYTTREGTLMAINAGANLICISHSEHLQLEALNRVKEAYKTGELSEETLNKRVSKILQYKEELDSFDFDKKYKEVKDIIESKITKEFAYNVIKQAVTLVKGKPFKKAKKTLLIASNPTITSIADEDDGICDIVSKVNRELEGFDTFRIKINPSRKETKSVLELAKEYEQIVFCSYNANIHIPQIDLINELSKLHNELHIIAMRNPFDLHFTDLIKNFVCFYEYTPNSLNALVEYLKGDLIPQGLSPIRDE